LLTCRWENRATRRSIPFATASRLRPMPLLAAIVFQGDSLVLALMMLADCQHQWVDAIAVGAEQAHFPAREASEQPPEGPFVAVAALPVNQPSCRAIVGLSDPHLVVFALQEVPHLIKFDHHRIARGGVETIKTQNCEFLLVI
jgi:hypothetical protein